MLKTWKVDYFPAHNKYMLDLILNEKIYPIEISKEFAKELGDSALIDSFIEQAYINENKHLKAENAELRERLEKAVELPCNVGDTVYEVYDKCDRRNCPFNGYFGGWRCDYEGKRRCEPFITTKKFCYSDIPRVGKTIFVTKKAAEARLADLKGEEK